jgi:hypothetical protein
MHRLIIFIRMPKAVLEIEKDGVTKTYQKYLNVEEMTLLIKDKFTNWKELVIK